MTLDSHVNSLSSAVTPALQYKLGEVNDSIQERRQVTFYPAGGNHYSPDSGVRVLRFNLSGEDTFLDPSTAWIHFRLINNSWVPGGDNTNNRIWLNAPLFCAFRRARCIVSGVNVEDQEYCHRVAAMKMLFSPQGTHANMAIGALSAGTAIDDSVKVGFPLSMFLGFLSIDKYIPLRFCPLTIEMELVTSVADIMMPNADVGGGVASQSTSWTVLDPTLSCDTCVVDPDLNSSFTKHLLSGKSLQLSFQSWPTSVHQVQDNWNLTLARAVSRLKACLVTMKYDADKESVNMRWPTTNELELQWVVGSKPAPENAIRGDISRYWKELQTAIGSHANMLHRPQFQLANYTTTEFIAGINFDKIMSTTNESNFASISTKAGELLHIRSKNSGTIDQVYVTLIHESLLIVEDTGVSLFT